MLTLPLIRLVITSVFPSLAMSAMPGASPAPITVLVHVDEARLPLHANGRSHGVGLCIDHGDGVTAGIRHVHFVPPGVHRKGGRAGTDRDHTVLPHVNHVQHGYGIAAAIADV